jgi:hypothetical protein
MADRARAILALLALAAMLQAEAGPAAQSQPVDGGKEVYPAEYFASGQPADAYDMVRKLPGFELIEIDDEIRGFSGSRGNVLFDGRVPSGKQESLEQMLRRIPATSVLRIELIRAGAGAAATGGFSLVANVVRKTKAASSYSLVGGVTAAPETGARPDLRAELSRQRGEQRLEATLALETDVDDDSGKGDIVESDGSGIISRQRRDEREVQRNLTADVEYQFGRIGGTLVGNLSVGRERTNEQIETAEDGNPTVAADKERIWTGEAGLQYRRVLGSGELNALLVHRRSWLRARAVEEGEAFDERTRSGESVGRLEFRRGQGRLRPFTSIEAALNTLDGRARLTENGVPVPISGSDAKVMEKRAEAAIGASWRLTDTLSIEPSLRAEISNIRSSGDNASNQTFLFLKPRIRTSWDGGANILQLTIEREAAQLDFEDFVASAELDRDDILVGAKSLRPPTTWSITAKIERKFWGDGSVALTFRREWVDDVIDRVVIDQDGELADAVGNIGHGRRRLIKAELTAPLSRFGITGAQLKASLAFLKSRVRDPLTGEWRLIAEDRPFEGELSLTHDLPGGRWSWGADASLRHREREFRFDEVREERKGTAFGAFVEFRPRPDWRIRAEVENLTKRKLTEERDKFDGSRSSAIVESNELRTITTSPIISLSLKKSFSASAP